MYNEIIRNQLPYGLYYNDENNQKELNVLGKALDRIQTKIDNFENETIVITATEIGLDKKEELFEIPTNYDKSVEQRRSHIVSKYRGNSNATVDLIKSVAESFSNGEVEVIEKYPNYCFIVKFISKKGIPPNIEDLKKEIERIKHAHLGVEYEFTYTVWLELIDKTWGSLPPLTWGELRTRMWD